MQNLENVEFQAFLPSVALVFAHNIAYVVNQQVNGPSGHEGILRDRSYAEAVLQMQSCILVCQWPFTRQGELTWQRVSFASGLGSRVAQRMELSVNQDHAKNNA